ncbi:glycosyl hydrolase catalytic core-domain-containing protein [Xylaria arbuscula]|nr:glycosyl hydrolase catalytic core-domain-containing protein [Xylaria arbuscula]
MRLTGFLAIAAAASSAAFAGPMSGSRVKTRSCSASFKNTVFNSGVNSEPDINGRFDTFPLPKKKQKERDIYIYMCVYIQITHKSHTVGFTLNNATGGDANLIANQIRMVVTADDIQAGVDLVTGPNPPAYLQLLNEPDGGFYRQAVLTPQEAVAALQPFLTASTSTQYLSPAPAYPESNWLPEFFAACGDACGTDRVPIILAYVYNPDASGAIAAIQAVMGQFPGRTIWITELSPASSADQGCALDAAGVVDWMDVVVGWAAQQEVIERVFWNPGDYGTLYPDDPDKCNPSLTNTDGTATALLEAYGSICA